MRAEEPSTVGQSDRWRSSHSARSVERVTAAHKNQVQTNLSLTGLKLGYFLNFGEAAIETGITRCVNGLEE